MTTDLLEQRLEGLSVESPDAGRVTARVLSRAAKPRARRLPRGVAAVLASLLLGVLVLYYMPAAATALASVPIAGNLLRQAGLVAAAGRITSVSSVSTSSGYRLQLIGAYADSTRTVLLLHAQPAILPGGSPNIALTDQFGRSYNVTEGYSDARTGDLILEFEALAWPDSITGARITLRLSEVQSADLPNQNVQGSWTLPATLGVDDGVPLPPPAPASLGPAHFRFTAVSYTPASVAIYIEVTGVTSEQLDRRIPDGGKGTPAFTIDLYDPNGQVINGTWSESSNQLPDRVGSVHIHFLGFRLGGGGKYVLRVRYLGEGDFQTVLTIP